MQLIAIVGAAPGIGKSTYCRALVMRLRSDGRTVEHFAEEDILTRLEFAQVAAEFTRTGRVDPQELVDATVAFLASTQADVVVTDALMPYVPTLLACGYNEAEINVIIAGLAGRIGHLEVRVVFLDGDAASALRRAEAREEPGWLDWYGDKLAGYGLVPVRPTFDDLCSYLVLERDVTLRVLAATPWAVTIEQWPATGSAAGHC